MGFNKELDLARSFVLQTGRNIFLTGKAGTGKTTFLKNIIQETPKKTVVVAPTGVAAINANGVTIHSFFQMPFGPIVPGYNFITKEKAQKITKKKIDIFRALELIIIDEISMVRADLLDGINHVLQKYRKNTKPFGGLQLLMIGDVQQLAPVARPEEWNLLQEHYETPYFFSSHAYQQAAVVTIALKEVYRQTNARFLTLLEEVRNNRISTQTLTQLNDRCIPLTETKEAEGYITLSSHNASAQRINMQKLERINRKAHLFEAEITGTFPEQSYPTEAELLLKEGAQVMFVKNDPSPEKQFYNGKIGVIERITKEQIHVTCQGEPSEVVCERLLWENKRYGIDKKGEEITEKVVGTFAQFPLRLAWAITIHKSQGLTFDKVIIDAGKAFAHGQTYVALSRCRTLEGIILSAPISRQAIICDQAVTTFTTDMASNPPSHTLLEGAKRAYQQDRLFQLFDFAPLEETLSTCINHARKAADESISEELLPTLREIQYNTLKQLSSVSKTFTHELTRRFRTDTNPETDATINERLRKSAHYFLPILEEQIHEKIDHTPWSTPNKALKKQLSSHLKEFHRSLDKKMAAFQSMKEGYSFERLIHAERHGTEQAPSSPKRKPRKGDSAKVTLALYQQGLCMEEIAIARGYTASTISSHLEQFVRSGEVDVAELVSEEKRAFITKFYELHPDAPLSEAKKALTNDISYEDIRLVLASREAP